MEEPVKKTGSSISEALYPGAWKSVPFEGRRRWRKGAKRNSWGEAGAIPGQPCQLVQTFRYVSRERWAPVLRIPCPFLGAVRLADLSCVLGSAAGRSAYRCRFRWFCSWGGRACGSRSLQLRRYQRAHEAGAPGHASQCVAIVAQDDGQAQPCWHSAAGVSCFFCACPTDKAA